MNWRRIFGRGISELSAATRFFSPPRKGLRILLYHAVGSGVTNDRYGIFSVTSRSFKSQMDLLTSFHDTKIRNFFSCEPFADQLNIAITFDDGYKDNMTVAVPILEKYRIPFTVFITTDFIQSGSSLYLSPQELRELAGHPLGTIGSHGVSHCPLTLCADRQLREELNSSKQYLEDITGMEISAIAYPYGAVDYRVIREAEKAGYKLGTGSIFNINRMPLNAMQLCRTPILSIDSRRVFEQKIRGDWDWCRFRPSTYPVSP